MSTLVEHQNFKLSIDSFSSSIGQPRKGLTFISSVFKKSKILVYTMEDLIIPNKWEDATFSWIWSTDSIT